MQRVISYTRFSSRKQARGLSEIRQMESAAAWCNENGYVLDVNDQYKDLGVSAFTGANAGYGALSELLRKLHSGEIERGTILIVEALDRITRQALPKAITLLMNIAMSGLEIVTLSDGKRWNEETMSDVGSFLMSVITLYRGHQESEYKSSRLLKTFAKHRKNSSQVAFGSAPGWLYRETKTSPWCVHQELAESVRKVYELAAKGYGSKAIARIANEEQWPVPTRLNMTEGRWHGQMPGQLLRNRAVLGEHVHRIRSYEAHSQHWLGLEAGEPIKNYYPSIISEALYNKARSAIASRMVARKRDDHCFNVWSGLLYCGECGAPIHRKTETRGVSGGQLVCSDKLAGLTKCKTMASRFLDASLLQSIYIYAANLLTVPTGAELVESIAAIEAQLAAKRAEAENIAEAIASGIKLRAIQIKAAKLDEDISKLEEELLSKKAEASDVDGADVFDDEVIVEVLSNLYVRSMEARELRMSLQLKLSRIVDTIFVYAYQVALIKYKDGDAYHVIPLPAKRLPSRANPKSKHHKPVKHKPEPFKPQLDQALRGDLIPPTARKPALRSSTKTLLIHDDTYPEPDNLEPALQLPRELLEM